MPGRTRDLAGRATECRLLEASLSDARGGRSRVLVVRGEPGIGKTALLDQAVTSAAGFQVLRAAGVESEMELAFAGLHQLCTPLYDSMALLPGPQREALRTALGLADGRPPDRFLVGLAVLNLLADASEHSPLLCVVEDAQWLDVASTHALAFAARRLLADRVCVLFATRYTLDELTGLPELVVEGLNDGDAIALLASAVSGPFDERVRSRVVAEAHGNPLALLEWPRGLTAAELAGGFGLSTISARAGQHEESFRRRLRELPPATQRFLTVAAAEPIGDPVLVWRAAGRLGVLAEDATPAIDAGLVELGTRVSFRHPTVRSAAYSGASPGFRRDAHRALAEVADAGADPDRRAWHLALAAPGPDEEVAAELEQSAGRALARGGFAAAAAQLERAAVLTLDPTDRARRTIDAAGVHLEAGAYEPAAPLLAAAEAGQLDEFSRARIELLRGTAAAGWGDMGDATDLLLQAATRLGPINLRGARAAYVLALAAAVGASHLARGATLIDVARAVRSATPGPEGPHDLLLDGLAMAVADGPAVAAPTLRRALSAVQRAELSGQDALPWHAHQLAAAALLWDFDSFHSSAVSQLQAARDLGALRLLPWALDGLAIANIIRGDLPTAALLIGEAKSVVEATGSRFALFSAAQLAGWRGHAPEAEAAFAVTINRGRTQAQGLAIKVAQFAAATLYNGVGRYDEACLAADEAAKPPMLWTTHLSLHELVEAAVRSGRPAIATRAAARLSESAQASGSGWALGVEARARALLSTGDTAEGLYLDAIDLLGSGPLQPEAARAHLLYGEWLRREDRPSDARQHLREAYGTLSAIGMDAFAERAGRELAATGESVRKRLPEPTHDLTPQELQIAGLAAEGRTNPEIGAQLFISARTVEWHLRKVFTKLGVRSRKELRRGLAHSG
jgi:DNA-binding CsgD family transcriptional regulator